MHLGRLDSRTGNQGGQSGFSSEPAGRRPAELRVNLPEESTSAPSNVEDSPPSYSQLYPTNITEVQTTSLEIEI